MVNLGQRVLFCAESEIQNVITREQKRHPFNQEIFYIFPSSEPFSTLKCKRAYAVKSYEYQLTTFTLNVMFF